MTMKQDREELEDCFRAYGIGHVDSHVLAEALIHFGWRKGREEWGVRFERDAGPTMDNPSGEVTNTHVVSDESNARACVERNVPISARNRRVVRRTVTEWEDA